LQQGTSINNASVFPEIGGADLSEVAQGRLFHTNRNQNRLKDSLQLAL